MVRGQTRTIEMKAREIQISEADWEATPASVKKLVEALMEEVAQLKIQVAVLEEKLGKNSKNSSKAPSGDGPEVKKGKEEKKEEGKKKRGGQVGHRGETRELYPLEACQEVIDHYPQACRRCGEGLSGEDPEPYRHQIVELPKIQPIVIEHRLHELECEHCGGKTRAKWPEGVNRGGYGERLSGLVALLSGAYRQSHQQVKTLLEVVCGIEISTGSINNLRREISKALEEIVGEAHEYAKKQRVVHSDETGFRQGNGDGGNPEHKRGWLWVLVTPMVVVFQFLLSRAQKGAKSLIGEDFEGILVSDRYGAYNWLDIGQRQVCWAHLRRDFIQIAQRSGVSREIGEGLLRLQEELFELWYQVRDGTLERTDFIGAVEPLRQQVKAILEEAASYPIGSKEKTPWAKTVRTCRQLLSVEPSLWTFVYHHEVEPTNNIAERTLRPAVIWKRLCFGTESHHGSLFVARILTVVSSLNAQQRDVLDFLSETFRSSRLNRPSPSLLPLSPADDESPIVS
jgi:transposase